MVLINGSRWLKSMRNEESFESFYGRVLIASEGVTDEPFLPRYRTAPRRLDDGVQSHRYDSPKDMYRLAYFEVLSLPLRRSPNASKSIKSIDVIQETESLLLGPGTANGKDIPDIFQAVSEYFEKRIDLARLRLQLCSCYQMPSRPPMKGLLNLIHHKKVTNHRTLVGAFNQSAISKCMLGEINKILLSNLQVLLQKGPSLPFAESKRSCRSP